MSNYWCTMYFLFASLVVFSYTPVTGNIYEKLHYFETLKSKDIHVITKRSVDPNPQSHHKFVHLKGLGREFNFYLRSNQNLLTNDFEATVIGADNQEYPLYIDKNVIYEGALQDEDQSHVEAVWEGSNLLATITTPNDTYSIEPSWRHMPGNKNHTMIIYKGSDVISFKKFNETNQHFCGYMPAVNLTDEEYNQTVLMAEMYDKSHLKNSTFQYHEDDPVTDHHRSRRDTYTYTVCPIIVVADYTFFRNVGHSSTLATANYLIHIMSKVNNVFYNTVWDEQKNVQGFSMKIKAVRIHSAYSETGYNKKQRWEYRPLLTAFSSDSIFKNFCLAHLFTCQKFEDGVLGLAYIASDRRKTLGGICSSARYHMGAIQNLNTGWSSSMNTRGHHILTQEAQIVTSHEFGHNFGSEHDPGAGICAPSSFEDGKYVMYPFAVSGYELNNWKFSPCSKKFVTKVLLEKANLCFAARTEYICGNGKIDKDHGEECDVGYLSSLSKGKCCTIKCRFTPGAQCSPLNHECCTNNCTFAHQGVVCRSLQEASICLQNSSCTGLNSSCPKSAFKADYTECLDKGKCLKGKCLSFCEARNLNSCICDAVSNACYHCCYGQDKICKPYSEELSLLPDGRPCIQGFCEGGKCKKVVQNVILRLFNIFEKIITDDFGEFMKSNIVTTVIILSAMLWIPFSCLISHYDKKQRKLESSVTEWNHPANTSFQSTNTEKKLFASENIPSPEISISSHSRSASSPVRETTL